MVPNDTDETSDRAAPACGPLGLIAAAVHVGIRPPVVGVGVVAGVTVGGLLGSSGALAYVRSPAAVPYGVVAMGLAVVIWSVAGGTVAVAASDPSASARCAFRLAVRRAHRLVLATIPAALVVAALVGLQVMVFRLTQMGERGPLGELPARPLALIALVYMLVFVFNVVVVAPVCAFQWMVVACVMRGVHPIHAYGQACATVFSQPRIAFSTLLGVVIIASAAVVALTSFVLFGLLLASVMQVIGAGELLILRFSEPLVADMFTSVTVDNLAAVVVMATVIGSAIGAAISPGAMFGVAGGTCLVQGIRRVGDCAPR